MAYFHYRCGERITIMNENLTAVRNSSEFDHGLVISAEPLTNDVLFEIKIDKKINSWSGTIVVGVTECSPMYLEFPPSASKLQEGSWIMAGNTVLKDGVAINEYYGVDLDKLNQDDRVGVMRTSEGDLVFYINGESQGVAAEGVPAVLYAIVDLYGKCVQVSITQPVAREHNNDDCMSGSSVLAIDNDVLNVTLGADLSELSLSSSNSLDVRMDTNVSLGLPDENLPAARADRLRFHERAGTLVKLSAGQRTAERRRPLDEFNNGVVMTHRPLQDNELFEIRLDRLVDKWSGSIEMGITTHNPSGLDFPATMTNMRSGTIMMSGCGILTNGKGTRREYGEFNLDELGEGDRIGMMRRSNGCLHYFINGLDQGIAASRVPVTVWGVIDLYGMTIRVSIVERDEREEQNLMTRRNTREQQQPEPIAAPDYYDRLTFHSLCGTHADVINNGRTAHRPNAADDFNNGVVLTARPLKPGELFEVRLDKVVTKWAGSIEIGVTTHSPVELEFPFTMTNVRSGTWMMTGNGVMHNGTTILDQYGLNLDRLQVGDRVGVERKENGTLHFYVNGIDQGPAASNVAERVYGVIDLYGQAAQATIIDMFDCNSPDTLNSSLSNTTLYSDLRFHHVHGKNARISNNGQTALRPRAFGEFNDAIVFSSRPLRDGELFEVTLDQMVDRWSGSIELGVTAVRPDDVELPCTATDLTRDTWMLSGSSVMENGVTIRSNYSCDLDALTAGTRVGVMRNADKGLEFYLNGVSQGIACRVPLASVYAVVDLYGQCAQVSLPCSSPVAPLASECVRSETSNSLQGVVSIIDNLHRFSEYCGKGVTLSEHNLVATRGRDLQNALVFGSDPLKCNEAFELVITSYAAHYSGTIRLGVTTYKPSIANPHAPTNIQNMQGACWYITGNEVRTKTKLLQHFTPSLSWLREGDHLRLQRSLEGTLRIFINSEELCLGVGLSGLPDDVYVFAELYGTCVGLRITSTRGPPTSPVRLQDSLELVLEPLNHDDGKLESVVIGEDVAAIEAKLEFYENHGRNIELLADKRTARRVASYNQGVVLVSRPLVIGKLLEVKIDQLDARWNSSLMVGVICTNPERLNFPVSCLGFKRPCCIIANDWLSMNGVKIKSEYGAKLNTIPAGTQVGVMITENNEVQLWLDGCPLEPVACDLPLGQPYYAVFDLYGQCQQISLVNGGEVMVDNAEALDKAMATSVTPTPQQPLPPPDEDEETEESDLQQCEKADLESHEKETQQDSSSLTLPLNNMIAASAAAPTVPLTPTITPSSPRRTLNCKYLLEVKGLYKSFMLPDEFFPGEEPICFCNNCFLVGQIQQDVDICKGESPVGWVKFPLRNLGNAQTDKWHSAFYGTKLSVVRAVLDRGQPLTIEQMKWCNLCPRRHDKGESGSAQIKFYPSLTKAISSDLSFILTTPTSINQLSQKKEASAAFQLLVKPGAYSTGCDSTEWSTKESGAVSLHALLLRIQDC